MADNRYKKKTINDNKLIFVITEKLQCQSFIIDLIQRASKIQDDVNPPLPGTLLAFSISHGVSSARNPFAMDRRAEISLAKKARACIYAAKPHRPRYRPRVRKCLEDLMPDKHPHCGPLDNGYLEAS